MAAKHDQDDEKPAAEKPKGESLLSAIGLTDKPHDDDTPDEKPKPKAEHKPKPKAEHKPAAKAEHKPAAKAEHKPAAKAAPPPEPCSRTIEELLADPKFDPDGHVRLRLAALSVSGGLGQRPPLDLVTSDGMPVAEA